MKLNYIKILLVMLLFSGSLAAQESQVVALEDLGFENIQVVIDGSDSYVSFEDKVYRETAQGIKQAIKAMQQIDPEQTLHLLVQDKGVAQIAITVPSGSNNLDVSYDTEQLVERLKGQTKTNSSFGKLDIVLYPELYLENSWFDKLYGLAINISPAAELSLWQGAKATAQVVVPLYTNMTDEKKYIRPGVITLSQDIRLSNQLYGSVSVGNFTDDRMGVDAALNYYTKSGRWNAGARAGLTGSSTFYGGEWLISKWQRLSWSGWLSHYIPSYGLEFKGEIVQKIYGDRGIQGSMYRYFGNTAIGFYAMLTDNYANGGFSFSVALPGQKRTKRDKGVRVSYPEYFTRVYKARNAATTLTGYSYSTSADAGGLQNFYNPSYIERELLK